ncbi:MAG: Hpt domain-containing protein [Leptolyngbyaceae cyanobacterium SM2_5_2]|nr:Hpt domain-containing protein [Leptolyngbyaceae cyanobacterium SM2_5_2]
MMATLAKAWETYHDTMQERLSVLEAAAAAMDGGHLSTALQDAGQAQAHKLAGSLGCFGFSEGSRIARELELLLQPEVPLGAQQTSRVAQLVRNLRQSMTSPEDPETISAAIASTPQLLVVGTNDPSVSS